MIMNISGAGQNVISVECDILVKMHQGTHSPDAFTNNMHEVAYHIRCSDGTGFSATLLTPIGTAGELVVSCDRDIHIPAGTANPSISPDGGGKRAIPETSCIEERVLQPEDGRPRFDSALRESWEISASLRDQNNRRLASFNPYFQVMDPSRFYDASAPNGMGRPVELCYMPELVGEDRCESVGYGLDLLGQPVFALQGRAPLRGREFQPRRQSGRTERLVHRRTRSQWQHRTVPWRDPSVGRSAGQRRPFDLGTGDRPEPQLRRPRRPRPQLICTR